MNEPAFDRFCHPEKMYYGTDFWMLNDALEDEEIVRQLHLMKEQGVYSFIARTYMGLKSDYPGENFKSKLRLMIDTAQKLDMKLFLQAGYMPEEVVGLPKEFALNYLHVYREGETVPDNETVLTTQQGFVFTLCNSGVFLDMFNAESMAFYMKQSYEDVWREFAPDFGSTILSIWVDEPSYAAEHLPYPLGIEQRFEARWGYPLRDHLAALFLDVDGYRTVRYHYHKLLQDLLEEHYFKTVREWCNKHGLWASGHLMREDSLETQIARAGAAMPFYKYFDMPGIDVLWGQMNWKHGELKPSAAELVPDGGDRYRYRQTMMTTPIQCASAARQMGAEHILCEMYAITTQNMTFRDQRYYFDYLAAHGINHRSVHGLFYSLKGHAKRAFPPHINYYQPYWNDVHVLYDYVASASQFVSLGKPEGKTLVIHPLDTAFCEYTSAFDSEVTGVQPSRKRLADLDANFLSLLTTLTLSHCVFDLGDERTIETMGRTDNGRFVIGDMSYNTVVLPDLTELQQHTRDKLIDFAAHGGRVIVLGKAPVLLDGIPQTNNILDAVHGITCVRDVCDLVPLISENEYTVTCEEDQNSVMVRRRVDGDNAYYFLFNVDCSSEKHVTLTVNHPVTVERWDGFSRAAYAVPCFYFDNRTAVDVVIPEGGSVMLCTTVGTETVLPLCQQVCSQPLSTAYRVQRHQKNALVLEFCSFRRGEESYGDDYPVLAVQQQLVEEKYSGPLTQRYTFTADRVFDGLQLALEDAAAHTIYFNGQKIPAVVNGYYCAKAFETVDLPPCRIGENTIELTREYVPLARIRSKIAALFETRRGVELECAYLLGDFAVRTFAEPERNGDHRYHRRMQLTDEVPTVRGDLTKAGYPFFTGTISLSQTFTFEGEPKDTVLSLSALDGCICRVYVNGVDCGCLHCAPYETDISDALRQGDNELVIELTNTLRNLLGPWHVPQGEQNPRSGYGYPDIGWLGVAKYNDNDWYDNRIPDTPYWTDSYMVLPLGIHGAKLVKQQRPKRVR